ncbi:glycosyltransferase family 2 protein [Marinobacter sp.]|uniref:glycosyltransferase family 2 protein n=1 Tax=Marinobacter sp. TaxID=50741 RepID=UPI002B463F73|nr:glycosyltransferase family 2 protein [Marinobacter sp.]HKK56623.1 glycosyltransferase family 2 protein [Marinobacter sp.]
MMLTDNSMRPGSGTRGQGEVLLTLGGVIFTLTAAFMAGQELMTVLAADAAAQKWGSVAMHGLFAFIIAVLIYGGLVYQFARLSCLRRAQRHQPVSREALECAFDGASPPLTILVPSYKEDTRVVYTTLMSAALQEYPNRRIVLLIDDPHAPTDAEDARQLEAARALPAKVEAQFETTARHFREALEAFQRRATEELDEVEECRRLQACYHEASQWFRAQEESWPRQDHADELFCERVLAAQADALQQRAQALTSLVHGSDQDVVTAARREYRRLLGLFSVEVTSFERKRYENLSHEPNKAMNLNSYIGLIGKAWRRVGEPGKQWLVPARRENCDLEVPDADFLITLDADSLILPDYALRLMHEMRRPGNERLAVIQTPYSAVPGAPGTLERIAGATTDIQYIIHQGFTGWQSTFWVGANALLRKSALEAIVQHDEERGHTVSRYIQDRTVIEDTESSIDLVERGWTLYNYPARLAYSATPPDFGSLMIQRRRWANGGLIILPKLLRFLARGPGRLQRLPQAFMRIHYLVSIALVNAGLLIILAVPLTDAVQSLWLPLTALPYFALYTRDMVKLGYRASDILRVYALNLVMIPVNLGGVAKSIQQAWTKAKIPFGRTPKVTGRTAAAPLYVAAIYLILAQWLVAAGFDFAAGRWAHGIFAAANAAMLAYGLVVFIGLRESLEDMTAGLAIGRYFGARRQGPATAAEAASKSRTDDETARRRKQFPTSCHLPAMVQSYPAEREKQSA